MIPTCCPVCECWVDELFDYYGSKMCDLCLEDAVHAEQVEEEEQHESEKE